jgi:hypothetical protein
MPDTKAPDSLALLKAAAIERGLQAVCRPTKQGLKVIVLTEDNRVVWDRQREEQWLLDGAAQALKELDQSIKNVNRWRAREGKPLIGV